MTTDFRALCAELVRAWDVTSDFDYNDFGNSVKSIVNRARAALSGEPAVPEGREPVAVTERPSDEEIMGLMPQQMHEDLAYAARAMANEAGTDNRKAKGFMRIALNRHAVDLARAVLARWGRPAPAPPADGEVAELVSAVHAAYAAYGWVEEKQFIRFFDEVSRLAGVIEEGCDCSVDGPINWQDEIELMCQRLKPVPVSERPWEREGWCDVEGRFWAEHISRSGVASWRCAVASDLGGWAVRCLPAHALPLPEVGED